MPKQRRVARRLGLKALLAATVTLPLSSAAATSASSQPSASAPTPQIRRAPVTGHRAPPLQVMTFNLRYASTQEPNSWADRRPVMSRLLRRAAPHVFGTQEGLYQQLRDIESDLAPHFAWIGTGREQISGDESTALFYDTRRLSPVEHDTFALSDTPQLLGSETWGGATPRTATWVRFRDLSDLGREFYVLNTHLDNESQYARERAAALIVRRIAGFDSSSPVVVTGDFNAYAHRDPAYDTMVGTGLIDAWDAAARRGPLYGTFHSRYRPPQPNGDRIDWIFVSPGVTVDRASIDTYSLNGQYPSDHFPVQVSLRLG
ncbi:endonuclease/exonuclease/phosphatase family protein [Streptomyces sp. NPDC047081]|uniref:endonuclease/exonuclease/phosphatase family protein n=1 Tax=Streptomyces sp. NPDC047081 TaxID=3154706 RepID=UPI0033D7617C